MLAVRKVAKACSQEARRLLTHESYPDIVAQTASVESPSPNRFALKSNRYFILPFEQPSSVMRGRCRSTWRGPSRRWAGRIGSGAGASDHRLGFPTDSFVLDVCFRRTRFAQLGKKGSMVESLWDTWGPGSSNGASP